MPTIDQIIQDEIARNVKREIRAAVREWLQNEASEAVAGQVKVAIQPFLVMMNDQRKVIEALQAQLEVSSHSLSRRPVPQPNKQSAKKVILFTSDSKELKNSSELATATPRTEDKSYRNEPRLPKERIIRVREKLGVTQLQMGTLLGVDAFVIQNWETGKTTPSIEQKRQIAFIRDLNLTERHRLFRAKKIRWRNGTK